MIAQQSVQPDLPDTSTGPSFQPAFVRVVPALHRAVAVRRNCWHFFPLQFYSLLSSAPMSQYHLQSYHIPAVPDTKASASSCAVFLSSYPTFLSSIQPSRRFLCRLLFIQNPCLVIGVTTLALPECSVRAECEDAAYYTI